jgi:hypothetical protein
VQRKFGGEGWHPVIAPALVFIDIRHPKLHFRPLIPLLFIRESTPLHLSALHGRLETCHLLLQCNANLEAKDCKWLLPPSTQTFVSQYETPFALFDSFAFLQIKDSAASLCYQQWPAWNLPPACRDKSRRHREGQVPQPFARTPSFAHSLRYSYGQTALNCAASNVAAYLRSMGAPEWGASQSHALTHASSRTLQGAQQTAGSLLRAREDAARMIKGQVAQTFDRRSEQ